MSKVCFTIILLILFPSFANSEPQNIKIEHITEQDGLSHSCISCIIQDSKGFIWIGTENGLNKYDGYTIKEYIHEPGNPHSLSSNFIRTLYQDPADSGKVLWIGTRGGGLNRLDLELEKFKAYRHNPKDPTSLSHNDIQCIYKDRAGTFWIGTEGGGLNEFDRARGEFLSYKHDPDDSNSISNNFIFAICEDKLGYLWVGNARYGALNRFDRQSKKFSHYKHNSNDQYSLPADGVYALHEDNYGELWVGTFLGLCKYDRKNNRFVRPQFNGVHSDILNKGTIWSIFEDVNDELWIAISNMGFVKINAQRDQFITFQKEPENLQSICANNISSLCVDRSGIVWVGTYCYGVNKLIPIRKKFSFYQNNSYDSTSLSHNWVMSICEDQDSTLWIGTVNGLNNFSSKDNSFSRYHFDAHKGISKVVSTNSGELWIAREFCLTKFIPDKKRFINFSGRNFTCDSDTDLDVRNNHQTDLIFERGINHVFIDKSENIWCIIGRISSEGKLYQFDPLKKQFIKFDFFNDQLNQTGINAIFEDRFGIYWIGMANGSLIKYLSPSQDSSNEKNRQFTQYWISQDDFFNLSETVINVIYEDERGVLWLGTNKGLHKFIPHLESFKHYGKKDGLASNLILGILEDDSQNLWLSTDKGLTKFNSKVEKFRTFDGSDGLPSTAFGTGAFCKSSTGKMYFGGKDGLIAFHPDSLKDNPHIPHVVITDFQLFNQSVAPGTNLPLEKSISHTHKIILDHDQNLISFGFAALDFTNPQKNQYAYKMEGVNQDWVYTDASRHYVTYTKLSPGKYIFRVKGSNNDGVWNEQGTSVRIIITPPWWRSHIAYVCYILIFLAILLGLRQFELRRSRLRGELKMRRFESQKLQEIDSMKSRFFANISHEFRTPLTLILGPISKMLEKTKDQEIKQELNMMQRNARRLQRLINQLLDLSKIEAGKMTLQARPENIVALLNRIVQSFESQAKLKGIDLKFQSEPDEIIAYIDRDKIENIFYNLLSNALKFTPFGGIVEVVVDVPDAGIMSGRAGEWARGSAISSTPTPSLTPSPTPSNEGRFVQITIKDTGIGIPPDRLDKIFARFYQVDDSYTREHEGTGIGLALTKELVDLHHGKIEVQSELNKGTTFTVYLPLGKAHLKPEEIVSETVVKEIQAEILQPVVVYEEKPSEGSQPSEGFAPLSRRKALPLVLIVEDNRDMRSYMQDCLASDYRVIEAENGEDGLHRAIDKIPDLIISDVMMPKMDGFELCGRLKSDERTSHIPVILLTARASAESKIKGLEHGADDYLIKPFDRNELLVRAKNLIEGRRKLREKFSRNIFLQPQDITVSSYDQRFLQRAMDIIEQHLADPDFDVTILTRAVGMSRMQLHRKLHALTNQSANKFIRSLRLKRAADLLSQQYGNVAQIAYEVGFSNPSYFADCFRKQFGKLPSEYKTIES